MKNTTDRIWNCAKETFPKAFATCLWMLKITLPISLLVKVMAYYGLMESCGNLFSSAFLLIGLPCDASVVFITSCFMPIYAPIALMATMTLTLKQATVLSLMCLASHNLVVECTIAKKTGSSFWNILFIRLGASFVFAACANMLIPETHEMFAVVNHYVEATSFLAVMGEWAMSSIGLIKLLLFIITLLMLLQSLLEEFGLIEHLCKWIAPLVKAMGLPETASFLWLIGNIVGLSYGSAILISMSNDGRINSSDADLVNHHLAVSHSLLEDTILFASLGICAWWLIVFRIPFAIAVVWIKRILMSSHFNLLSITLKMSPSKSLYR